jgi:16S rRNA (cytidine1402-2'-O)-methyltransferase
MAGFLYIVSLPIGNMEDITLRAIKTLRAVDFIVAEDTRNTRRILDRYRITTPFRRSYYQGVERERVDSLLSLLEEGKDLALVSDAGTPLISDPGYPLVRAAIEAGVVVIPIPGPTAAITALVSSGLATDHFAFDGAIPRKEGERRAYFERIRSERRTIIVHESPHRLLPTLETIAEVLPDRTIVLARELTKVHEEFLRGSPGEILEILRARGEIKGECVLLIAGNREPTSPHDHEAAKRLVALLKEEGTSNKVAVKILIEALDLPRNEAYRLVHSSP